MELNQKYHLLVLAKTGLIVLGLILLVVLVILFVGYLTGQSNIHTANLYGQTQVPDNITRESSGKPRSLGDYLKVFKERNIFTPTVPQTLEDVLAKVKWNMRLTGTIIDPNGVSVAFILNENVEGIYSEHDTIGPWEIKSILQDKVILEDENNNQMILKREDGTTTIKPASSTQAGQSETAQALEVFAALDAKDIVLRLKPIIKSMSEEVVRDRIEAVTGIPKEEIPKDADLTEYVGDLIIISQDGVLEKPTQVSIGLSFSTNVNQDNSPQSPNTLFAATDKRIYACFANQGELQGLKNIITRWINNADGSIVYIGKKTINAVTPWNFVWLEKNGWQPSSYSVQLTKTSAPSKVVAQGTFQIQ